MRKHALLNAIVPGIQVIALQLAFLAGGVVVVETLFAYPGIGLQLVDAVRNHDVADGAGAEHDHRRRLRRGEPDRGHPVHPVDPAREDGDLVMSTEVRTPHASRDRSGGALDVPARRCGRSASRSAWRSPCCWCCSRSSAPYFAPYGENEVVGPPFSKDGVPRHRLPRPGRAEPGVMYGGQEILVIAVLGTLLGMVLGIAIGVVAAYGGGWWDEVIMRLNDVVLAFPQILLALRRAHRGRAADGVDPDRCSSASRTPRASRGSRAASRSASCPATS